MSLTNFWGKLDAKARAELKPKLAAIGWKLGASGNGRWTARRFDHEWEFRDEKVSRSADGLLAAVEAYEAELERKPETADDDEEGWNDGL